MDFEEGIPSDQREFFKIKKARSQGSRHLTTTGPRTEQALPTVPLTEQLARLTDIQDPYQLIEEAKDILDRDRRDNLDEHDLAKIRKRERKIELGGSIIPGRDFDIAIEFDEEREQRVDAARARGLEPEHHVIIPNRDITLFARGLAEAISNPSVTPQPEVLAHIGFSHEGRASITHRNRHGEEPAVRALSDRFPRNATPEDVARNLAAFFQEQVTSSSPLVTQ